MESSTIAVFAALGMIGLAFLVLIVFGFRSLLNGKISIMKMAFILVPFVVFFIWYLITGGDMAEAAVLTVATMFALGMLSIFLSGLKSVFS